MFTLSTPPRRRARRAQSRRGLGALTVVAAAVVAASSAHAQHQTAMELPTIDEATQLVDRRGTVVPRHLEFVDQDGRRVKLGDYLDGRRPVILNLGYFGCPNVCGVIVEAMLDSVGGIGLDLGEDYQIVTISVDPDERADLARAKKDSYLAALDMPGAEAGWHFLTTASDVERAAIKGQTPEGNERLLSNAVGFNYEWSDFDKRYDHGTGLFVLSPDGVLTQVLQGVYYEPRDMRLALVEASEGKIGTAWDRILLTCYSYDPQQQTYGLMVWTVVRVAGGLTVFAVALMIFFLWRRERRQAPQPSVAG